MLHVLLSVDFLPSYDYTFEKDPFLFSKPNYFILM